MSRNALTALTAALAAAGGGYKGYGQDVERKRIAKREDEDRAESERRYREGNTLQMLGMGFDPADTATAGAQGMRQAGENAVMGGAGMTTSLVGRALEATGRTREQDITSGRRATVGGQEYVQPFSVTQQGREQAALAEQRRREALAAQQREQEAQEAIEAEQRKFERDLQLRRVPQAQDRSPERAPDIDQFVAQQAAMFARQANPISGDFPSRAEVDEFAETIRNLYERPTAGAMPTPPSTGGRAGGGQASDQEVRARAWASANPRKSGESQSAYAARMRAAVLGGR
jgi:hypothetical protein